MTLNILGTDYEVQRLGYHDDPTFSSKGVSGYCDDFSKLIVYCDMDTVEVWKCEPEKTRREFEKETLRHEIVHAFLSESGLNESSHDADSWARDEEIVEWFALQGPKIYRSWEEADAL